CLRLTRRKEVLRPQRESAQLAPTAHYHTLRVAGDSFQNRVELTCCLSDRDPWPELREHVSQQTERILSHRNPDRGLRLAQFPAHARRLRHRDGDLRWHHTDDGERAVVPIDDSDRRADHVTATAELPLPLPV